MQKIQNQLLFSPTDLTRFMESSFASWMSRLYLEHPDRVTPDADSAEKKLIAESGTQHELNYLARIKQEGRDVCEISKTDVSRAKQQTLEAMQNGRVVIYQACLELEEFRGYADFLFKVPGGNAHTYEVADTKLARSVKPYYLVQLCCYSEMLASLQGVRPQQMQVVLGDGKLKTFRVEDFLHYHRQLKTDFLEQMAAFDPHGQPPLPDPRADHGRWQSHADKILLDADHLAQVAGINVGQIKKLAACGITTVAALAKVGGKTVPKIPGEITARLVEQAALQVQTRELHAAAMPGDLIRPVYKVLKPDPDSPRRGLEMLPPPSLRDVYFDMEGFPLVEGGLEYLFGAVCHDRIRPEGALEFKDWWAHDRAEEKTAFEGFIDWVYSRWQQDATLHVYHYADYERAAVRRLASRHATRENEVDELLRNNVFVDLYQVVRHGLRVGGPNYSIKTIELLYREKRKGDVKTAGESMVYYANWIESGQPRDWEKASWLKDIRVYNEDDCQSTHQLVVWLRKLQDAEGITYLPPAKPETEANSSKQEQLAELVDLQQKLEKKLAACATDSPEARITELFGHVLEFHRREDKPGWWRLFDWLEKTPQERQEDLTSLEGLTLAGDERVQDKRSWIYTYAFDPNSDTKIRTGDRIKLDHQNLPSATVAEMNTASGLIKLKISQQELKKSLNECMPRSTAIFLHEQVRADAIVTAIRELAAQWADRGGIPSPLLCFLNRLPPQITGTASGQSLMLTGESAPAAALRIVTSMQNSALCIQGPPGTGKTTTAAKIIASLLGAGKKVGIMSNSHKAIQNLLRASSRAMNGPMRGVYAGKSEEDAADTGNKELRVACPGLVIAPGGPTAAEIYSDGVLAGTAWLFARDEMKARVDYLFIDEAGQVSLANLVAVSRSTANIILMGDQMQLEQPIQGTHPGDSGQSALNYYLQDDATIPETLGIFLGVSYRMHPDICQFISEMAYEGRLQAAPENQTQRLALPAAGGKLVRQDCGIVFSPVEHDGNTQGSDEEVARIQEIVSELLGRTLTNRDGKARPLTLLDILFVAPYNMQVRKLQDRFPDARVGSVDKFQGQEAPVVIVSMCSSAGEFGSRGLEFLLDKNRMNVAISRAKTLAIVVGDQRIATTQAGTVAQMEKLNLFCKLIQESGSSKNANWIIPENLTSMKKKEPLAAPLGPRPALTIDALIQAIQQSLTPDLLKPRFREGNVTNPLFGHCYHSAEALYHLIRQLGLPVEYHSYRPCRGDDPGGSGHWWLENDGGRRLDPTAGQYEALKYAPPYNSRRFIPFLTKQPSKRAVVVITGVLDLL